MTLLEKIKLLFVVRKPVEKLAEDVKEIKKGYKTISFWATVLLSLTSVVGSLQGYIDPKISLIITVFLGCTYNILRAIQNSQIEGVTPLIYSTRFWTGILTILLASLTSLKDGGIAAPWVISGISLIGGIMTLAQAYGLKEPEKSANPPPENPS